MPGYSAISGYFHVECIVECHGILEVQDILTLEVFYKLRHMLYLCHFGSVDLFLNIYCHKVERSFFFRESRHRTLTFSWVMNKKKSVYFT